MDVFERITELLEGNAAGFRVMEHEPVRTSEQAARVRGTPLEQGAKALVLKAGDEFVMVVISAAVKVDFGKLRAYLGGGKVRFATPEEVAERTGCQPGGVPPFGNLFGLRVIVDPTLTEHERIDFNAGERTKSVDMRTEDYLRIVSPEIVDVGSRRP